MTTFQKDIKPPAQGDYFQLGAGLDYEQLADGTNRLVATTAGGAPIGDYDPAGTATAAIADHVAAGDPHGQYRLSSELVVWDEIVGRAAGAVAATAGVYLPVNDPTGTGLFTIPTISMVAGQAPPNVGEFLFPGGHVIGKERTGTQTDWEFWHGQNANGHPNMKLAMGVAALFNAPAGNANVVQLHQYAASVTNLPMLDFTRWVSYANNVSDFASARESVAGVVTTFWRLRGDGSMVGVVASAQTASGIYSAVDYVQNIAPAGAAASAQFISFRLSANFKGAAGSSFAAIIGISADSVIDATAAVNATGQMVGVFGAVSNNSARTLTTGRGVYGVLRNTVAGGVVTTGSALYALTQNLANGSITTSYGVNVNASSSGGGAITTYYGVRVQAPTTSTSGTFGTIYQLYLDAATVGGTANWSLYVAGGASRLMGSPCLGDGALAVGAVLGFAHLTSIAGAPTGAPTLQAGYIPGAIDAAAGRLWLYYGGAWHYAQLT